MSTNLWDTLNLDIEQAIGEEAIADARRREQQRQGEAARAARQCDELRACMVAAWPADILEATAATVELEKNGEPVIVLTVDGERWQARPWGRDWRLECPTDDRMILPSAGPDLRRAVLLAIGYYRPAMALQREREAKIAALLDDARARLWTWPAGREITLYHWCWCRAPGTDEANAEFDGGWTDQSTPDADGFLVFPGETSHALPRAPRHLRLSPDSLPTVERFTFSSIESLPHRLTDIATICTLSDDPQADEDGCRSVGRVPVAWVRRLVDEVEDWPPSLRPRPASPPRTRSWPTPSSASAPPAG